MFCQMTMMFVAAQFEPATGNQGPFLQSLTSTDQNNAQPVRSSTSPQGVAAAPVRNMSSVKPAMVPVLPSIIDMGDGYKSISRHSAVPMRR
jgi:hypothetical protein